MNWLKCLALLMINAECFKPLQHRTLTTLRRAAGDEQDDASALLAEAAKLRAEA
eukprot:CAMPEP_0119259384 /NCGR_PEP_ID=MMETSP1329-20130426/228_1 /TAXON_ID=114041 /ORGANISM="Genus nov. species nov., Strain RCC1024" /LENGTH=53 /DNA_ID=CAMNT_0007258763 /DNA_START=83 /DNA_END=240 /DNA_ORIENTATION=+